MSLLTLRQNKLKLVSTLEAWQTMAYADYYSVLINKVTQSEV